MFQALSICKQKDARAGQVPGNGEIFIMIYSCIAIHGCILPPCSQLWLTFAPIPDFTAKFYNVSEDNVNLFSLVFFVVSLVIGLFSIVVLDTWGLKVSVSFGFSTFFFVFIFSLCLSSPLSFLSSLSNYLIQFCLAVLGVLIPENQTKPK